MNEKDVVRKDEEELQRLDAEIAQARQHLKEELHEGERTFIDEGSDEGDDKGDVDNSIAP